MVYTEPDFPIGIEEEYLLVDRDTRDVVIDPPAEMMAECASLIEGQVGPEFLRAQIEVGPRVCGTVQEARSDLARLRRVVGEIAARARAGAGRHVDALVRLVARPETHRQGALQRAGRGYAGGWHAALRAPERRPEETLQRGEQTPTASRSERGD